MIRALIIGDSHLKIGMAEDAAKFITQLILLARSGDYDYFILLGDQGDTFAVARIEILALWSEFFREASKHVKVIALVGNHDMAGADGGPSLMEPFKAYANVTIVDDLYVSMPPELRSLSLVFIPFIRDNAEFEKRCGLIDPNSIVFCHQSFNGAQFQNGFYDPHGADPACVARFRSVVSGHIHLQQRLGNIWYPGTPFQQGSSDAGQDKKVFSVEISDEKGIVVTDETTLDMPTYEVIEANSTADLLSVVSQMQVKRNTVYKLVAKGSPSEIVEFWNHETVKHLKKSAKRVVDALTSVKPTFTLPGSTGKTHKEKLHEFIRSKEWRTDADRVLSRAERLLAD